MNGMCVLEGSSIAIGFTCVMQPKQILKMKTVKASWTDEQIQLKHISSNLNDLPSVAFELNEYGRGLSKFAHSDLHITHACYIIAWSFDSPGGKRLQ